MAASIPAPALHSDTPLGLLCCRQTKAIRAQNPKKGHFLYAINGGVHHTQPQLSRGAGASTS